MILPTVLALGEAGGHSESAWRRRGSSTRAAGTRRRCAAPSVRRWPPDGSKGWIAGDSRPRSASPAALPRESSSTSRTGRG
ncbi:MAG: hypothetical protein DME01_07430 [Candidatus Rokuibacteriota bacterium]|nr:MAG: hypothetical protein DME01_07430 [Candidatus Rokubacteria bacterium]